MSPTELAQRLNSPNPPRLLDVRQPEEHELVALPGSRLIPLNELIARTGELADWKGEELVVYCHHGVRSAHAVGWLSRHGFNQLANLSGGIDRWAVEVDSTMTRY